MTRVAVGICLLLSSVAQAESAADILKRWDAAAKDFYAFTADLTETRYTKVVNHKEILKAVVRLRRTDKGVNGIVHFMDENPHTIHFLGDRVEDFKPGANQMDIYDVKKYSGLVKDVLMLGFGTSGKDVRSTYLVKDAVPDTIGSLRTTRLELVPKDQKFRDIADKLEVWIPEGGVNPVQVKSTPPKSGDYDIYAYSNVKLLKPPLKDSDFDYDPDQKPNKSTHQVPMN